MAASQSTLPLTPFHYNHQLFSDYYLDQLLPRRAEWQALVAEANQLRDQLRRIYAGASDRNEAQTEDDLIKPTLRLLEHTFEVQASLRTPGGTKKPDYVFYRDHAALEANRNKTLDEALLRPGAFAVGDAKQWNRPLDAALKNRSGQVLDNTNPAYQISFYMQHSGLPWGILTNGRLWRLYHHSSAYKLERYYEVDLMELLEHDDPAAFVYFFAFFRRAAFDAGPLSLDELLRASADYAQAISENLKTQVYTALRHVAQGFLDYAPNGLKTDSATLKTIYDNSLIVLYRLLFVFYAEARELLPVRENAGYREEYSLDAIKREVARRRQTGPTLLSSTARLWAKLRDLFGIINAGSPPLQVATFNGGLFDPQRHPFLERNSIGDARLQEALDMLARVDGRFIDYRDLQERHLGTIYEGLLEYHLASSDEPGWTVDLLNAKGERHRTGSYYTPEFVVQYIVDQTLGPVLRRGVTNATTDAERIAAVLAVNVCDPSTGSGHFLVAATEYIARFLLDLGVVPQDNTSGEADLAYWKRRVVQSCIYGVDLNPLAVDLAKLSLWLATVAKDRPLSFLDHHVRCGNALVGARVADVGSAAPPRRASKPSKKEQQARAAGQLSMLDDDAFRRSLSSAVDSLFLIEANPALTVADVKEQEQAYAALRADLTQRYARLADLHTAARWGLPVDATLWPALSDYVAGRALAAPRPLVELAEQAHALAAQQRFFHWDLEFPEVFFDRHGQPLGTGAGFDVVVGNPPYVRQEQLAPLKPYLQHEYEETYNGAADLYVYFYQQGLRLLQTGGRMSYIVTNKWLRAGYGEGLRELFATHAQIEQIVDFGHAPIFADADVFPCIIVLERPADDAPPAAGEVQVTAFPREALRVSQLGTYVETHRHAVPQARFGRAAWSLERNDVDDLMERIRRAGVLLAEFAGVKPYRGVLTGLNEAFLIDTPTKERLVRDDARSAEIIKPYLRGQDIKRWSPEWDGLWMIFARRGIDIDAYPAIKQHLVQFREQLEPRPRDWSGGEWKGRKAGSYRWYEIQDSVDYWNIFEKDKIVYQEIQFHSQFCFDNTGVYGNNKTFILPSSDFYMLAVLNSPIMWWYNWRYLPHMKDEALSPVGELVINLPIAPPNDAIRAEVEPAVERLLAITRADQEARRATLDWLRTEFNIDKPGQRLEAFAKLDEAAFIEEVRKRRPRNATLTPASLRALRNGYTEQATPVQSRRVEAQRLEQRLAELVNQAYGLTPEDIKLLWRTAPPRMPVGMLEAESNF